MNSQLPRRLGAGLSRRRFVKGTLGLSATLTAASPRAETTAQTTKTGGQIVFGTTSDAATLIPILSADSISSSVIYALYDPLVAIDPIKLTPIPWLANEWDVSPDGQTYTFHLRSGIRFHDGTPLTADDVAYTINAILDKNNDSFMLARFTRVESAVAIDPVTVKVTTKGVYAPFLSYLPDARIMPKHLLQGQNYRTTSFATHPVGSGPFKFKEWIAGDHITLVANEDYYLGRPKLDSLIYRIIPNDASMVAALRTGEVHVAGIEATDVPDLSATPSVQIFETPSWGFQTISLNLTQPRFQDARVRQAIIYSLPREQMVQQLAGGHGYIANSYLPKQSWAHDPNVQPTYGLDIAKAKQLMAEAGWIAPHGSSQIQKDGQPFKFTLLSSTGVTPGFNETIQQSLQNLGMVVNIQLLDFPTLLNRYVTQRNFDFVTIDTVLPLDPDDPNLWACGLNAFGFCSSTFDALAQKAAGTLDINKRKPYYWQMQEYVAQNVPRLFLYSEDTLRAQNKRVNLGQISSANYTLGCSTLWPHQWSVTS